MEESLTRTVKETFVRNSRTLNRDDENPRIGTPKIIVVGLVRYLGRDGMGSKAREIAKGVRSGTTNNAEVMVSSLRHPEVDIKPN
jgi:hypothetical protein